MVDLQAEELARQGAQSALDVSQRIQQEFPNARLDIKTVNVRNGKIEVLDLTATYADGTVQKVPRMVIDH